MKTSEWVEVPSYSVDDRKVFTVKVKANIAYFWQRDEFSAIMSDSVVSRKLKLAIKDSFDLKF